MVPYAGSRQRRLAFCAGLSGGPDEEQPQTGVDDRYAVWHEDFERQIRAEVADYTELEQQARELLEADGELPAPQRGVKSMPGEASRRGLTSSRSVTPFGRN